MQTSCGTDHPANQSVAYSTDLTQQSDEMVNTDYRLSTNKKEWQLLLPTEFLAAYGN
jgi:hypothetical protein